MSSRHVFEAKITLIEYNLADMGHSQADVHDR